VAQYFVRHPWVLIAAVIVYVVSPFDLLPEALVGPIGYLDDLVMMLLPLLVREYARKRPKDYVDTTAR
jgi:uncharacterized membrane protein YkvA (DUF1232 family)